MVHLVASIASIAFYFAITRLHPKLVSTSSMEALPLDNTAENDANINDIPIEMLILKSRSAFNCLRSGAPLIIIREEKMKKQGIKANRVWQ